MGHQFNSDETVYVDPIICLSETKKEFERRLILFYTGLTRSASSILAVQSKNMQNKNSKRDTMAKMVALTKKIELALSKNKLDSIGELLHKNWVLKRTMAQGVSNSTIDDWYEKALKHGALGGKILGAGGGGFLLLYAQPQKHTKILSALRELRPFPVRFEPQGSKIIFVD